MERLKILIRGVYNSYKLVFLWWTIFIFIDIIVTNYYMCISQYNTEINYLYNTSLSLFAIQSILILSFIGLWGKEKINNDSQGGNFGFGTNEIKPVIIPIYYLMLISLSKIIIKVSQFNFKNDYIIVWIILFIASGFYWLKLKNEAKKSYEIKGTILIIMYTLFVIYYKEIEPIISAIFNISGCIIEQIKLK
ncbi:hypothetical protein ACOTVT_10640 [Aliarcobacter butzleri]